MTYSYQSDANAGASSEKFIARSEWQPIENAPTDGTGFLYFAPAGFGLRIIDAGYFDGHTFRAVNFYGDDDPTIEPTHWMPLPAPPDAELNISNEPERTDVRLNSGPSLPGSSS